MAGFTDALRGDGLAKTQEALAGLRGDPLRLDRERDRFQHSPSPFTSNPSGTTTRSGSPNPPSEARLIQIGLERCASKPEEQFSHQVDEEAKRIFKADRDGTYLIPIGSDPYTVATQNVKKLWVDQGIWNDKWNQFAFGRWKHEEPLEGESDSDIDAAGTSPPFLSFRQKPQLKSKSRRPKRENKERCIVREHERDASRPYQQFIFQISKERERLQRESPNKDADIAPDINTRAYENIKNTWTKRGIWNTQWGILPGMNWKHEEPFQEEIADEHAVHSYHEVEAAPTIHVFGSPSSVESNHHQVSGALDLYQQGHLASIDSARVGNGNAEPSSMSNSPPFSSRKRGYQPTGQLPRTRKTSYLDGLPANTSLGPVHSSKIRKSSQRRPNVSPKVSFGVAKPQISPPPAHVTLRRSNRIRQPNPGATKNVTNTPSISSAKPCGVSKGQSLKSNRRTRKT